MRNVGFFLAISTVLLSGCASAPDAAMRAVATTGLDEGVKVYDVAPAGAQSLGPVTATACDGPREVATKRLLGLARNQGANGVSQLSCTDEGISWYCWSRSKCEAIALNIPPPPRSVKPPQRVKRGRTDNYWPGPFFDTAGRLKFATRE